MDARRLKALPFSDPSFDSILEAWLRGKLNAEVVGVLRERLATDAVFRESFCEWIKALREPGWASEAQNVKRGIA